MNSLKKLDTILALAGAIFLTLCYCHYKDNFLQALVAGGWMGFFALTNNKKPSE